MRTITIKIPEMDECAFEFTALPEDMHPGEIFYGEGFDLAWVMEDWHEIGDISPRWFYAEVICSNHAFPFVGEGLLGACSYESYEEFLQSDSYKELKREAYEHLISFIKSLEVKNA